MMDMEQKVREFIKNPKFPPPLFYSPFARKKRQPGEVDYATFSGRMFAMTLDMVLLFLLLEPFFLWLSTLVFPQFDHAEVMGQLTAILQAFLQQSLSQEEAVSAMLATGIGKRLLFDYLSQIMVTGLIVIEIWRKYATTPGMYLLGMYIADADTGGKPTVHQYILRYIGVILAILPLMLGMLWIIFDKRKQGWQDKLANTVVLQKFRKSWWERWKERNSA